MSEQLNSNVHEQARRTEALKQAIMQARAKKVIASRAAGAGATSARIAPAVRNGQVPLSWAQQRLWFLHQLDAAAGAAYHMSVALKLHGELDKRALKAALDRIVFRHENLRTGFIHAEGMPAQEIAAPDTGFDLRAYDLRTLEGAARELAVEQLRSNTAGEPFDLAKAGLIRGSLLCLSETEHVLFLTQHHIISDGWSLGVLVKEVASLYLAYVQGLADPLPALAIQYADYAIWQRDWLKGETLRKQIDFWKNTLQGAPALLALPLDRPRPAVQSYVGKSVDFTLSAQIRTDVRALCQRHGVTPFMALLTGWAILLSRLSGQDDVVIGSPVANRQRSEIEGLIGCFVNTLALRVRLEDDPSVTRLLASVKADTLDAYSHQDLPFDQVVEAVKPPRSMGHNAIFQTMMAMNTTPAGGAVDLPGLTLSAMPQPQSTSQFDLSLSLADTGSTIGARLEYASDLFDEATIQRLARQFEAVLAAMVADTEQAVSRIDLLDREARDQLLRQFNASATAPVAEPFMHLSFEVQAAASGAAIALVGNGQRLSYAELNRRANRVAHYLRARGVAADDRVAICVERSIEMVVGLLGILKAGAAYVPLDPVHPAERLGYMIGDCEPVAVLTQQQLLPLLPPEVHAVVLDHPQFTDALSQEDDANPASAQMHPDQLAYVLYTSGSTGLPKGVMVTHRNVANLLAHHIALCGMNRDDRVMQFASFGFDTSVTEIFAPFAVGAQVVLRPAQIKVPDSSFIDFLRLEQITVADLPTAFWSLWAGEVGEGRSMPYAPLRLVIVGGEKAEQRHLRAWSGAAGMPDVRWINTYGPTETTIYTTAIAYDRHSAIPAQEVPIGKPIANTTLYLLDRHLQPVPLGVTGEIHVGGEGVARGYLKRADLTAARFIDDPFSTRPGARLYKSGDLGRWLPDGNVEYVGRSDFQVKIRGFRIELGEIEARLSAYAGVREALVMAREDRHGDKRLVAYLSTAAEARPGLADLRQHLLASMAEYMVPGAFVILDAFPLTPNGKIDRKALPAPDQDAIVSRSYETPQDAVEHAVAEIWQDLLQLERVGRQDQFFELGGHSLLAIQLLARVKQALGVDVALTELFARPSLAGFSAAISAQQPAAASANLIGIRGGGALRPVFFIHDGSGGLGYVHGMLPWIGSGFPVHGLLATGLGEHEAPLDSIEEMAASYLRQVRAVQPHGPYRLAGYSAGGLIAYEMANQLLGADEGVDFLGLLDTQWAAAPAPPARAAPPAADVAIDAAEAAEVMEVIDALKAPTSRYPSVQAEALAAFGLASGIDALLLRCQREGLVPADMSVALVRRFMAVGRAITKALAGYTRPAIGIPVSLFAATEKANAARPATPEALRQADVRVIPVPGNHFTMMDGLHIEALGHAFAVELGAQQHAGLAPRELAYAPCVTIQQGAAGETPLFCVPGAGAAVTSFTSLAREMPSSMPIYGFQPRGYCGVLAPHIDVPSAARAYIKAMREIAPAGPYRLVGHSFGGWVVFDMALQLLAEGAQVELLVALDSEAPFEAAPRKRHSRVETLVKLASLFALNASAPLGLVAADFASLDAEAQLALLLDKLIAVKLMPARTTIAVLRAIVRVFETNLNTRYRPDAPYPNTLHLVDVAGREASASAAAVQPRSVGAWFDNVAQVRSWRGPGNHVTLLSAPHVKELAAWLRQAIEEAKAARTSKVMPLRHRHETHSANEECPSGQLRQGN